MATKSILKSLTIKDDESCRKIFEDTKEHISIDTIKIVLTPIFEKYGVKKAILFGSFAKNTMTEKSDVDLLVDSGLKGLKFIGFTEDIKNAVSRHVDVLDVTHIEKGSGIEKEISRHGKVIFNRTDN